MKVHRAARRLAALTLILALCLCGTASAGEYGYEIDPAAMKDCEAASLFDVQVTEKKVVEECFDSSDIFGYQMDALVVTVTNNSSSVISAVTVYFVTYDAENKTTCPTSSGSVTSISSAKATPKLNALQRDDLALAPGESCLLSTKVDYENFVGARAMVSEYTAADGTVVANPDFPAWQNLAFGLSAGNVTELD